MNAPLPQFDSNLENGFFQNKKPREKPNTHINGLPFQEIFTNMSLSQQINEKAQQTKDLPNTKTVVTDFKKINNRSVKGNLAGENQISSKMKDSSDEPLLAATQKQEKIEKGPISDTQGKRHMSRQSAEKGEVILEEKSLPKSSVSIDRVPSKDVIPNTSQSQQINKKAQQTKDLPNTKTVVTDFKKIINRSVKGNMAGENQISYKMKGSSDETILAATQKQEKIEKGPISNTQGKRHMSRQSAEKGEVIFGEKSLPKSSVLMANKIESKKNNSSSKNFDESKFNTGKSLIDDDFDIPTRNVIRKRALENNQGAGQFSTLDSKKNIEQKVVTPLKLKNNKFKKLQNKLSNQILANLEINNGTNVSTLSHKTISKSNIVARISEVVIQSTNTSETNKIYKVDGGQMGELEIKMFQEKAAIKAIIIVETNDVKAGMEKLLSSVKDKLNEKGIQLESVEVEVNNKEEKKSSKGRQNFQNLNMKIVEEDDVSILLSENRIREFGYNTLEVLA